jgi:CheY-like chemotaxis protein
VLVVEDDPGFRQVVVSMCHSLGYGALSVADAEQALSLIPTLEQLRLVLSDLVLPGSSGAELAETLSKTNPDLPVVLMSGYSPDELPVPEGIPLLAKPFRRADLGRLVSGLLEPAQPAADD